MLVGQRKKSQKYFDLSTFNYNLYDSNPCSSLGVMKFQKWELFSGSPGTFLNPTTLKLFQFSRQYPKALILLGKLVFLGWKSYPEGNVSVRAKKLTKKHRPGHPFNYLFQQDI